EALCWLAPHVAVAVKNSRNTAELLRSQLELKRINRDLEKRVEERAQQISRAKREWERTFDAIGEPIFLVQNFVVQRANTAFAQLAGRSIRDVVGRACHVLLAGRATPCDGCPLATGQVRGEVVHPARSPAAAPRTFEVSAFPFEEGNSTSVVSYRDVTASRAMEQKLRESERLASVGQLAAGAAHEINNPLGFVKSNLGALESYFSDLQRVVSRVEALEALARSGQLERLRRLALDGIVTADARVALEDAPAVLSESRDGVRRVGEIVQALKELSRDNARGTSREPVLDLVGRAAARAGLKSSRLELAVVGAPAVVGEPQQLEVALANVLRNAAQASPETAPIRIEAHRRGAEVELAVVDRGCGMTPEVRARIFDPFFTTREVGRGIGLGLTAAWGIVARHRGRIEVHSQPGAGTSVRIALPAAD
ncbi:MAG: ATP-binding protein, partial [Myxococcales bacterium]